MGEAKRRKKLDPNWGKTKPLLADNAEVPAISRESERYRVISVNGILKIASVSEIEFEAGYHDYPPSWATHYEFEGTVKECERWLDEYMAETWPGLI